MKGFTVEDVAGEAGLSRATLYRYFPGGRDQLVGETVTWEVGRFFARLAEAIDDAPDFRTRVERGLAFAHRALREHEAFQRAMATDQGEIQARLAGIAPIVVGVIRSYLEPLLEPRRPGRGRHPHRGRRPPGPPHRQPHRRRGHLGPRRPRPGPRARRPLAPRRHRRRRPRLIRPNLVRCMLGHRRGPRHRFDASRRP